MIHIINELTNNIEINTDNLVIGFFDGIHYGHNRLFVDNVGHTTVLTFNFLKHNSFLIYPLQERLDLINNLYNPDNIIVLDLQAINMDAKTFIDVFLKSWKFKQIIVGSDFKFGSDQQDINLLKQHFKVKTIHRASNDISTTQIKKWLMSGEIELVNENLVCEYTYCSEVIKGQQLGRKLGYRTANFLYEQSYVFPGDGVYITKALLDNQWYEAITFIGVPKTIDGATIKQFETHLINYSGPDFYQKKIKIAFCKKIDEVKKYPSFDALIAGIKSQVQQAKDYFLTKK